MNMKRLSLLAGFILVFGGTAQATCFESVSLGEYPLGEWSDAGRTWVVSDTVGSFSDVVTTLSAAETEAMNMKRLSLLAGFIPVFGGTAQATCFESVSLGEYPLGEWSDAGRTWVVSDTVGSFSDVVTTLSAAETQRDVLLDQCSEKGNAVIAEVERRLNERKAGLGAEFDRTCTDPVFCPMVRDITIRSREHEIDQEIGRMRSWYRASIGRCEEHFNYTFNTLSPRLCPQ